MKSPVLSMAALAVIASLTLVTEVRSVLASSGDQFSPTLRLSGIGVDRERITSLVLEERTKRMIDAQTFTILRYPLALSGAERITGPRLRPLFERASQQSGLPVSLISAVAYLESWGDAQAESPAGPKGIMQISEGTARAMGLRIIRATKYQIVKETRQTKTKRGKIVTKTVKRKVPYTVLVRDERLMPEYAIPAAARYLARLEQKLGGRDWAIWAYHCGEGCAAEFQELIGRAENMGKGPVPVSRVFFTQNPAFNKQLYAAIQRHMDRDFSPTYFFRVSRAEQLLELFREDPSEFRHLYAEYRNRENPNQRAPHRLSVWLKPNDLTYQSCDDLRREQGRSLVAAFDEPDYFGFRLRTTGLGALGEEDPGNREFYRLASPATIGTLAYLAFETRRLHEAMHPRGEKFVPLEVTGLVKPMDVATRFVKAAATPRYNESLSHCSGQVFDLALDRLPPGEREALEFVLEDMGWAGYLGFVQESSRNETLHIGSSPTSREFFSQIYRQAIAAAK